MRILHTITVTNWSKNHNASIQSERYIIRSKKLTHQGIQRMLRSGCSEYDADTEICVTRVETAIYAR